MNATCAELAKVSLNFRGIASRLMSSDFEDAKDNLQRFVSFIDKTPVLKEQIDDSLSHCTRSWDMTRVVNEVRPGSPYKIPVEKDEEIVFTYDLLNCILVSKQEYWRFCWCYLDCGPKIQNYVDKFHRQVVHPFYQHLVSYLEQVSIDMGCRGSDALVRIHGNQNQLTIAQGGSTATTVGVFGEAQANELREAVDELVASLPEGLLKPNEADDLHGLLGEAAEQARAEQPKRWVLVTAMEKLGSLAARVATDVAVEAAVQRVQMLIGAAIAKLT